MHELHLFCLDSAPKVLGKRARFPHFIVFFITVRLDDLQASGHKGGLMSFWAEGSVGLIRLGRGYSDHSNTMLHYNRTTPLF